VRSGEFGASKLDLIAGFSFGEDQKAYLNRRYNDQRPSENGEPQGISRNPVVSLLGGRNIIGFCLGAAAALGCWIIGACK
jgi:hypothetical protein